MSSARRKILRAGAKAERSARSPKVLGHQGFTWWNGQPTPCRRVVVRVAAPPEDVPLHWLNQEEFKHLVGTDVRAVEVKYDGHKWYMLNEDGSAWYKVTEGMGSPRWGHKDLPIEKVVIE